MAISAATLSAMNTRYSILFNQSLQAAETKWKQIAMSVTSKTKTEHYPFRGAFPKMREWLGDRHFKQLQMYDYSITNRKFETTVEIPLEAVEDDQFGMFDDPIRDIGAEAAFWPEDLIGDVMLAAGSTIAYDGQYFFDTDHPIDMGNPSTPVQANLLTGRPLNEANLAFARAHMMRWVNETGRILRVNPRLLVVPATLENTARKLVDAEYISQTGGSTQNNSGLKGTFDVLVLPQLDAVSTTDWYIMDVSRNVKPFIFQLRIAPQFQTPVNFGDHLAKTDNLVYGCRARGNAGLALWQLALKVQAA